MTQSLLLELVVQELPPKALKLLGEAFTRSLTESLSEQGLTTPETVSTAFASPRRLAAHLTAVRETAADRAVSQKLMPVAIGLDSEGRPTPALLKRLQSLGLDASAAEKLSQRQEGKTLVLFLETLQKGIALADGLQKALLTALEKLPIPKVMSYQLSDGWTTVRFVRPAQKLVALHGSNVVPVTALGLTAGRETLGHRFEAKVTPIVLSDADAYATTLKTQGGVIASFAERRAEISAQLAAAAAQLGGDASPVRDDALLDEVTALVENPNVLVGTFEERFLEVPQECLILTMKANQKYFPLLDARGNLTSRFLIVANIHPEDPTAIIRGNERVVRPRLSDAKFFFDQDKKRSLASRVPALGNVVYHNKLGTQLERMERVKQLSRWVAERIGAEVELAERAAFLAKADLLTDMVGEFPELQGIMGGHYARLDGEHPAVADAIATQYAVRRDETSQGENVISEALILADRAEILVGIWGIGIRPTGDKDPFGLRRHALSLIKSFEVLGGRADRLLVGDLLRFAVSTFAPGVLKQDPVEELLEFIYERYFQKLAPLYGSNAVESVTALRPPLQEVIARVKAVLEFQKLEEASSLAAANKRVSNILKKAQNAAPGNVSPALLREPAELALFEALNRVAPSAKSAFDAKDYTRSLQALAALKGPVDTFFEKVMVNVDDAELRTNRLLLLGELASLMNRVADLGRSTA